MSQTVIGVGDPLAIKRWSTDLAIDVNVNSYWSKKFVKKGSNAVIQQLTELESDAGDTIQFDLVGQLRQQPVEGDARAEGKEEDMKFFSDEVRIDQIRHPVGSGGRMTRKRTLHNLRGTAKNLLSQYWARVMDEMLFIYESGARGSNEDFVFPIGWTGRAGNPVQAPDAAHVMFGGDATSDATIDSSDIMSRNLIERAETYARMMRSRNPSTTNFQAVDVEGEGRYVVVMSPDQEHSLRTESTAGWLDIQKAAAAAEGRNNPLFKGGLGMIKNTVLHSHESVIRFSNWGSGSNLPGARALFLGRQAGVIAYGTGNSGGSRFMWQEDTFDYGNQVAINAGTIVGVKKTRFNGKDYGVLALDTYALPVT